MRPPASHILPLNFAARRITIAMSLRIERLVLVCLGWCCAHTAMAQSLAPRAYLITPAGANAIDLQYSYLDGSLQFDGGAPITGATLASNVYPGRGTQGHSCTHTFSTVNTAFVPPNANELESAIRRGIFPRAAPAT